MIRHVKTSIKFILWPSRQCRYSIWYSYTKNVTILKVFYPIHYPKIDSFSQFWWILLLARVFLTCHFFNTEEKSSFLKVKPPSWLTHLYFTYRYMRERQTNPSWRSNQLQRPTTAQLVHDCWALSRGGGLPPPPPRVCVCVCTLLDGYGFFNIGDSPTTQQTTRSCTTIPICQGSNRWPQPFSFATILSFMHL